MENITTNSRFALKLLVSILYIGIIVALSLLPANNFPKVPLFPGADKVVHAAMYFMFAVILLWAFHGRKISRWKLYGFIISWGIIMEIVQNLMDLGRHFSLLDILANITGAFLGIIAFRLLVSKYLG